MVNVKDYQEKLAEYVAFKSISTDPAFQDEIQKTVDWLEALFTENGFTVSQLQGSTTNPVVIADYVVDPALETVIVYGHYDVQPAENDEQNGRMWTEDAFKLSIRDGRMYARGVVDNKGQNLIHIMTVSELIKREELEYNVRFIIEGNEETGNNDMTQLMKDNLEVFTADYVLISDGEVTAGKPTLEASLRGGFSVRVLIKGPKNDLHSGLAGGVVPNPALYAAQFVAKLKDDNGRVQIPGFYDGVQSITKDQEASFEPMPSDEELRQVLGVKALVKTEDIPAYAYVGLRPTIEISGFGSGYTGDGFQNIVPANADFRVNFRTVDGQDGQAIYDSFSKMLFEEIPESVDCSIEECSGIYPAVSLGVQSEKAMEVRELLATHYNDQVIIKYVGGGIPIVADFQALTGVDALLVSFGNEDCNMHGIDENFLIALAEKACKFSWAFFSK